MIFAAAYAALALWSFSRYVSRSGRDRFMALDDDRARAARDLLTSRWIRYGVLLLAVQNTVHLALAVHRSAWTSGGVSAAGVALSAAAVVLLPRARATVEAAATERALPAEPGRETSVRRARRTGQFRAVTIAAFLAAVAASFLYGVVDSVWVAVVLGTAWLVTVVGVLGMAWASVWIYGDEQPADAADGPR